MVKCLQQARIHPNYFISGFSSLSTDVLKFSLRDVFVKFSQILFRFRFALLPGLRFLARADRRASFADAFRRRRSKKHDSFFDQEPDVYQTEIVVSANGVEDVTFTARNEQTA
jgi:hypothetical protein